MYRIEIRIDHGDGYQGGWSNWSKTYTSIRRAFQALRYYRECDNMYQVSYCNKVFTNYWEYRIINFYPKVLQVSK